MIWTKIKKLMTLKSRQRKIAAAQAKRLNEKASLFCQALTESKIKTASQILKQYPKIASHASLKQLHVMRHLAQRLSKPETDEETRHLYLTLHKAGLQSSPTDIALMIRQPENMSLIHHLYQNQPNLQRAVEFVKPLHKLALLMAKPQSSQKNAEMFVALHRIGLKTNAEDVALLFQNTQNIPVIQYIFLAQPELMPGQNKSYDKEYAHAAQIGKNIEGLKLLYLSGAKLSQNQANASGLIQNERANISRRQIIHQRMNLKQHVHSL